MSANDVNPKLKDTRKSVVNGTEPNTTTTSNGTSSQFRAKKRCSKKKKVVRATDWDERDIDSPARINDKVNDGKKTLAGAVAYSSRANPIASTNQSNEPLDDIHSTRVTASNSNLKIAALPNVNFHRGASEDKTSVEVLNKIGAKLKDDSRILVKNGTQRNATMTSDGSCSQLNKKERCCKKKNIPRKSLVVQATALEEADEDSPAELTNTVSYINKTNTSGANHFGLTNQSKETLLDGIRNTQGTVANSNLKIAASQNINFHRGEQDDKQNNLLKNTSGMCVNGTELNTVPTSNKSGSQLKIGTAQESRHGPDVLAKKRDALVMKTAVKKPSSRLSVDCLFAANPGARRMSETRLKLLPSEQMFCASPEHDPVALPSESIQENESKAPSKAKEQAPSLPLSVYGQVISATKASRDVSVRKADARENVKQLAQDENIEGSGIRNIRILDYGNAMASEPASDSDTDQSDAQRLNGACATRHDVINTRDGICAKMKNDACLKVQIAKVQECVKTRVQGSSCAKEGAKENVQDLRCASVHKGAKVLEEIREEIQVQDDAPSACGPIMESVNQSRSTGHLGESEMNESEKCDRVSENDLTKKPPLAARSSVKVSKGEPQRAARRVVKFVHFVSSDTEHNACNDHSRTGGQGDVASGANSMKIEEEPLRIVASLRNLPAGLGAIPKRNADEKAEAAVSNLPVGISAIAGHVADKEARGASNNLLADLGASPKSKADEKAGAEVNNLLAVFDAIPKCKAVDEAGAEVNNLLAVLDAIPKCKADDDAGAELNNLPAVFDATPKCKADDDAGAEVNNLPAVFDVTPKCKADDDAGAELNNLPAVLDAIPKCKADNEAGAAVFKLSHGLGAIPEGKTVETGANVKETRDVACEAHLCCSHVMEGFHPREANVHFELTDSISNLCPALAEVHLDGHKLDVYRSDMNTVAKKNVQEEHVTMSRHPMQKSNDNRGLQSASYCSAESQQSELSSHKAKASLSASKVSSYKANASQANKKDLQVNLVATAAAKSSEQNTLHQGNAVQCRASVFRKQADQSLASDSGSAESTINAEPKVTVDRDKNLIQTSILRFLREAKSCKSSSDLSVLPAKSVMSRNEDMTGAKVSCGQYENNYVVMVVDESNVLSRFKSTLHRSNALPAWHNGAAARIEPIIVHQLNHGACCCNKGTNAIADQPVYFPSISSHLQPSLSYGELKSTDLAHSNDCVDVLHLDGSLQSATYSHAPPASTKVAAPVIEIQSLETLDCLSHVDQALTLAKILSSSRRASQTTAELDPLSDLSPIPFSAEPSSVPRSSRSTDRRRRFFGLVERMGEELNNPEDESFQPLIARFQRLLKLGDETCHVDDSSGDDLGLYVTALHGLDDSLEDSSVSKVGPERSQGGHGSHGGEGSQGREGSQCGEGSRGREGSQCGKGSRGREGSQFEEESMGKEGSLDGAASQGGVGSQGSDGSQGKEGSRDGEESRSEEGSRGIEGSRSRKGSQNGARSQSVVGSPDGADLGSAMDEDDRSAGHGTENCSWWFGLDGERSQIAGNVAQCWRQKVKQKVKESANMQSETYREAEGVKVAGMAAAMGTRQKTVAPIGEQKMKNQSQKDDRSCEYDDLNEDGMPYENSVAQKQPIDDIQHIDDILHGSLKPTARKWSNSSSDLDNSSYVFEENESDGTDTMVKLVGEEFCMNGSNHINWNSSYDVESATGSSCDGEPVVSDAAEKVNQKGVCKSPKSAEGKNNTTNGAIAGKKDSSESQTSAVTNSIKYHHAMTESKRGPVDRLSAFNHFATDKRALSYRAVDVSKKASLDQRAQPVDKKASAAIKINSATGNEMCPCDAAVSMHANNPTINFPTSEAGETMRCQKRELCAHKNATTSNDDQSVMNQIPTIVINTISTAVLGSTIPPLAQKSTGASHPTETTLHMGIPALKIPSPFARSTKTKRTPVPLKMGSMEDLADEIQHVGGPVLRMTNANRDEEGDVFEPL